MEYRRCPHCHKAVEEMEKVTLCDGCGRQMSKDDGLNVVGHWQSARMTNGHVLLFCPPCLNIMARRTADAEHSGL